MKVLHVNTSDHTGGAAIAALRLIKALRQNGVDAKLLCRDRTLPLERTEVVSLAPSPWRKLKFALERAEIFAANGFSRKGLFAVDTARYGNDITLLPEFAEADIIHLHWTNQAMLSLPLLEKILKKGKPVVWTMHDMWTFTGVCHYADKCTQWQQACQHCTQLRRPSANDLSARVFKRKVKVYAHPNLTLVACSNWLADLARKAPLLEGHRIESIPNPIDTQFYQPAADKAEVRRSLGIPTDKTVLFFTAFKVTDPKKGVDYLSESLTLLVQEHPELREKLVLVLGGQQSDTMADSFCIPTVALPFDNSEEVMRARYQAADLLLMPTLMDNLPNTIVEAMACGVPVVGFNVGGLPQMIETGVNGYLADYCNSLDFANGIARILSSASYPALCRNARSKALQAYSEKAVAENFIKLYSEELAKCAR